MDGVGIVAILEKHNGPELLLQKQFRPPINKVTIEVPAGLVDEGETPQLAAVRELREETGYVGEVLKNEYGVTPVMFNGGCLMQRNRRVHSDEGRQIRGFATRTLTWYMSRWICPGRRIRS